MSPWIDIAISAPDPRSWVTEDYACGELTLVWRTGAGGERLIFAVVELLPPFLEADPSDRLHPAPSLRIPESRDQLHCGRAHLSPKDAIDWYRECLTGEVDLPLALQTASSGVTLHTDALADEPAWPVMPYEKMPFWEHQPLWGERPGGVRRHQLVQLAPEAVIEGWAPKALETASAWLRDWLPVDPLGHSFLHGSAHLVLPNPLFSAVHYQSGKGADQELFFEVVPYPGRSIAGLEVLLKESRPGGPALIHYHTLHGPQTRIRLPYFPESIDFAITCPMRGLLYDSPSTGYIAQVGVTVQIGTRQRQVTVPASRGRSEETFQVPVTNEGLRILIGDPIAAPVGKVAQAYAENSARFRAQQVEQHWFNDDRGRATAIIRSLIGQATSGILMVDPYFGATELLRFAAAVGRVRLPVRILTAENFLRRASKKELETAGQKLARQVAHMSAQDSTLSIKVRVALGDPAPIHDRFLCVDDVVRALGSSLNEFGSRGTMLLKLPAPKEIWPQLEAAWDEAPSLNDFLLRHDGAPPRPRYR